MRTTTTTVPHRNHGLFDRMTPPPSNLHPCPLPKTYRRRTRSARERSTTPRVRPSDHHHRTQRFHHRLRNHHRYLRTHRTRRTHPLPLRRRRRRRSSTNPSLEAPPFYARVAPRPRVAPSAIARLRTPTTILPVVSAFAASPRVLVRAPPPPQTTSRCCWRRRQPSPQGTSRAGRGAGRTPIVWTTTTGTTGTSRCWWTPRARASSSVIASVVTRT